MKANLDARVSGAEITGVGPDELLIVELDDRLEFAAAVVSDTNIGCNNSSCSQNGFCPKK
jgi:hypothetical protein